MKNKKMKIAGIFVVILAIAVPVIFKVLHRSSSPEVVREVRPFVGKIERIISTTGTVLPKNRLAIKPPVNGRVENVLVQEGEKVKIGQVLSWMSSTDRAALLDNARGQGEDVLKYWQDVYKPIALLAPIDGEVIVATTQPGQTVTTADSVVVLSDHLIVRAQVDETDIGGVKLGQKAVITLDAYPDTKIKAGVDHIYYESQTVNNVTIYNVDLMPEETPLYFRSGMNATVNFVAQSKDNVLLVPTEAVHVEKGESFVLVSQPDKEPMKREVKTGMSDDKNTEIVSGISESDTLVLKSKKYTIPKNATGTNPFMPARRR
jgi:macrolide-specific efflux system membrane fusion protein